MYKIYAVEIISVRGKYGGVLTDLCTFTRKIRELREKGIHITVKLFSQFVNRRGRRLDVNTNEHGNSNNPEGK